MRLYDLADQYNDLIDMLEQDADNEALESMLGGLEGRIEDKVDAVLSVRNAKRAEAKAIREEITRLTERAARSDNEANRLEVLVESTMLKLGMEKMKTLKFTTWMQLSPPSVVVLDESAIPKNYFVTPDPKLMKNSILEAWKDGHLVSGVEIRQTKSLRVR